MNGALSRAWMVAKAARGRVTASAVGTALALMLGLAGCTMSHGQGTDEDGDGHDATVDCDDGDARIYPGAVEPPTDYDCCSEPATDFDCDGEPIACSCNPFPDFDGDGYSYDDCNDDDPNIYPGAPEEAVFPDCCDGMGVDMNCDGVPLVCACNPFPEDVDGDGYEAAIDCNDSDATVHPGAAEGPCPDGVDQNCDGTDGDAVLGCPADNDHDGYPFPADCNDEDPTTHPGAIEWDCPDGVDQNCDGVDGDPSIICNGMADVPENDTDHA